MAEEREEKKLKASTINVFQKIAVALMVTVAGVVTTLISLNSHSQITQLKNELSNKEVELVNAYNLLTKLKKELNDTKDQLDKANFFGERLANEEEQLIKIYNIEITQLKKELSNQEGEIQRLRRELFSLTENSLQITKIDSVGGEGGNPFDDYAIDKDSRLTRIEVKSSSWIDGIRIQIDGNFFEWRGKGNAKVDGITIDSDDSVTHIIVYYEPNHWINGLEVHTNNQSKTFGRTVGTRTQLSVPQGYELIGFHGKSKDALDQIGLTVRLK